MAEPGSDKDTAASSSIPPGTTHLSTRQIGKYAQEKSCSTSSKSVTEAIVLDAGPDIPIIDADEFIKDFLPHVPGTDAVVGRIVSWIENCPKYYERRRWKKFVQDPEKYKQREPAVFARLADVFNAVVEAVADIMPELEASRTTTYIEKPTKPPETVFRKDLSRPDAYFLFREQFSADEKNPHWMDIAVSGEFKKENNPETAESDITQVLWDMHQLMREDPRRRRCFGFTIENRDFRMYSTTRSEIVVSRVVDFFSSPSHIIKFFFALMYSSEESLGRDMTMTTIWNGDVHTTPQYDIQVQSREDDLSPIVLRTFRTTELISSIGAEAIRGRGTRVWKVNEVIGGKVEKKTYVLKDAWVDSDRMREGKVVATIREDAEKQLEDKKEKEVLLRCLLTTLVEGDVLLSDGTADRTLSGRKCGRHIVKNTDRFSLTPYTAPSKLKPTAPPSGVAPKRKRKGARGGEEKSPGDHKDVTDGSEGLQQAIVYDAKTHYRIVFAEACDVLHELTSLFDIVYTLWKVCNALEALHKLGWVHRDISSGNIMICGNDAKITDFEYAKKMTLPGKVHEVRTGTEDFMAIEVRAQEFSFIYDTEDEDETEDDDDDMWNPARDVHAKARRGPLKKKPAKVSSSYTWFYNPLHDMESIFWLFLYFVTNKDVFLGDPIFREMPYVFSPETEDQQHRRILGHWNFGLTLFSGRNGRDRVMLIPAPLTNHLDSHPLHPAIDPLADIILKLRAALVKNYRRIEKNPPSIDYNSGAEVHQAFEAYMTSAVNHLLTIPFDVQVRSLRGAVEKLPENFSTTHASTGSKRVRDDDGGDGHRSKSPRVSVEQKSPSRNASAEVQSDEVVPKSKTAVPLPTRVLRSHSRKMAVEVKTSPPSPRPVRRARKETAPKARKGKATKNHEAVKAATKIAATKAKTKSRKGR